MGRMGEGAELLDGVASRTVSCGSATGPAEGEDAVDWGRATEVGEVGEIGEVGRGTAVGSSNAGGGPERTESDRTIRLGLDGGERVACRPSGLVPDEKEPARPRVAVDGVRESVGRRASAPSNAGGSVPGPYLGTTCVSSSPSMWDGRRTRTRRGTRGSR